MKSGWRGRIYHWFDKRLALGALGDFLLNEPMPGGASAWYVFGSGLVFILLMQVLTGILLLFYYAPTMDHAWHSIRYIMQEVPFGAFIRGLHHWGASVMIVVAVIHVTQVFVWGAYKRQRELTWLAGLTALACVLGFAWTGYLLPWDQLAYWGTMVGTEIIGTIPLIGDPLATFLRGGGSIGAQTLSRFFAIHIWLLPVILFSVVGFHLYSFRKQGVAGPFHGTPEQLEKRKAFFFPRQLFIDLVFILALFIVLIGLAVFASPELRSPANPAISPAHVAPEWYFLFLFQLLKYFPQQWIIVGTFIIPSIMVISLIGLPFYDRRSERHPVRRLRAIGIYCAGLTTIIVLTTLAIIEVPPTLAVNPQMAERGHKLFEQNECAGCHTIHGKGGNVGPDLSYEGLSGRDPDWIRGHFRNPSRYAKGSIMPTAKEFGLSEKDIEALTHYMFSLK